jgi:hypothetical protein
MNKEEREEIRLFLDHSEFRWNQEKEFELGKYKFTTKLSEKVQLHIVVDDRLGMKAGFQSLKREDSLEMEKTVDLNRDTEVVELFKAIFYGYLELYANNQKAIESKLQGDVGLVRNIKDIPKWENVKFLRSIMSQIEKGLEKGKSEKEILTRKQIETIEKIKREREFASQKEEKERRLKILNSMENSHLAGWDQWEKNFIKATKNKITSGEFLSKKDKEVLAEKLDKLNMPQSWGPYVDKKRNLKPEQEPQWK